MLDALEMERDRVVDAIKAEFAVGPQTLERMDAIARRHCGGRWWPICMPVVFGGFDVVVLQRQPPPAGAPPVA